MWYIICLISFSPALSDAELIAVRDGFEGRRDQALQIQVQDPYPGVKDANDLRLYSWNRFSYALAALFLSVLLVSPSRRAASASGIKSGVLMIPTPGGFFDPCLIGCRD